MNTKKTSTKNAARATPPRPLSIRSFNLDSASSEECSRAALILNYTHESSVALLKAFDLARAERAGRLQASRGMTTDEEQDLLRAMLVTVASGLDSMLKQLIGDALPRIAHNDSQARRGLERFLSHKIRFETETDEKVRDRDFLARVLASAQPSQTVITEYITELKRHSLQSAEELSRTVSAFGLQPNDVGIVNLLNLSLKGGKPIIEPYKL